MRITKENIHILGAVLAAMLLSAGCSSSTAREVSQKEAEEIITIHYEDIVSESRHTEETTTAAEEAAQESTPPQDDAPIKKQPPEGFELILNSPDWGLSFGDPGTQPAGNAAVEDLAWYDAYFMGGDSEKVIYLTFDCGYENGNTAPILDALKNHNAPATFFVVGHFLETAPDLVRRMTDEGHKVGNHTYHHPDMSAISNEDDFEKELNGVEDLYFEITGTRLAPYYRPPQGKANAANIQMAQDLGYNTVFWSLAYVDWDTENQPGHTEAFDKLTSRIHPGAVVLLHNTSRTNGEIMDELLTKWESMGYSFRPLSDLVAAH